VISFEYLEEDAHFVSTTSTQTQTVYRYGDQMDGRSMRGVIHIPLLAEHQFYYSFFEVGYPLQKNQNIEPPDWFMELVRKAANLTNKKFRLQRLLS
jgi:hypothetical protein